MSGSSIFIEIYRVTLDFLGKLVIPLVILMLGFTYKDDFSAAFKGLRISKIESPIVSASFEEISNELANAAPGSNQEKRVLKKIETKQEAVKVEIESGIRSEIPVEAVSVGQEINSDSSWKSLLDISWVKPNDLFGRTYFIDVNDKIYIWPVTLDEESNKAMFVINTSKESRKTGVPILKNVWVNEGDSYEFNYDEKRYRINLVDIRKAGKIPSNAAFVSVDEKRS